MPTFTIRWPRSQVAAVGPSQNAPATTVPERDVQRDKPAAPRRPLVLAAPCIVILAIVAYLVLRLAWADGAAVRCFLLHGDAALRRCEDVIASDQPAEVRAEASYNRGVELDALGRHAEAVWAYGEAVRLKPDYARAYTNMGVALAKLRRWDDAVHAYRAAIRARPEYADAYYNLALTLADLRRWGDALDAFREAVRLNPADADAFYNMGLVLNRLRRHEEALEAYSAAVRIKPDYANAWGNLGMTAYLLGRYNKSVEAFERARSLVPTYFDGREVQWKALEESRLGRPRWLEHR